MHAASFAEDPKHLGFVLARYKFVAKMFQDMHTVLEVGCGDCTGANLVKRVVNEWVGCDVTPLVDADDVHEFDMVSYGPEPIPFKSDFNGIYALDVLEHILPEDENRFIENMATWLYSNGALIIGSPSLESQPYASLNSKMQHVNCKTEEGMRKTLGRHFSNVFLFGMQDETLTTGFGPMCHYRLAVCTGKR